MDDEEEFCGLFDERGLPELQRPFLTKCNELEDCAACRYAKYSEITECIQHFAYELHVGKITIKDSFAK